MTITEADRATAGRVIRRHLMPGPRTAIEAWNSVIPRVAPLLNKPDGDGRSWSGFCADLVEEVALAAAQGRAYAAALRGAK